MGGLHIENDGPGAKTGWHIDEDGRGQVLNINVQKEEEAAFDGRSFILHGECHLAAASSGGLMSLTNNSTTESYRIGRIYFDPHVITPSDLLVVQVKGPATTTGGTDISSTGIVNKNFGSLKQMTATLKISDGSSNLTYTGGSQYHSFSARNMVSTFRDMKGTNVITPGTTILWGWKTEGGGSATDAETIGISVNLYAEDLEKL